MQQKIYQCKTDQLPGSSYNEVHGAARIVSRKIEKQTKRRPYVRSRYFYKDKIFINSFWTHLDHKNSRDRVRRMKLLPCGIELLRHNTYEPVTKENPNK